MVGTTGLVEIIMRESCLIVFYKYWATAWVEIVNSLELCDYVSASFVTPPGALHDTFFTVDIQKCWPPAYSHLNADLNFCLLDDLGRQENSKNSDWWQILNSRLDNTINTGS